MINQISVIYAARVHNRKNIYKLLPFWMRTIRAENSNKYKNRNKHISVVAKCNITFNFSILDIPRSISRKMEISKKKFLFRTPYHTYITLNRIIFWLSIHYIFLSFPEFSNWPDIQWDYKVSVSPFATATKNLVCSCYLCQFLFWFFPLWFMFSKKMKLEQHLKIC